MKLAFFPIIFLALVTHASAVVTVFVSSEGGVGGPKRVLTSSNAILNSATHSVLVGFFDDPVGNSATIGGSNFLDMFNLFTVLGDSNGDAGSGAGTIDINNGDGSFNGSITGIDAMAGTGFVASNTPLYLLVQANDQTEWGIFHDSGWVVPTDGIITIPEQVFTVDTSEVLRGVDNGATLGLALVPEPSIALLGLFGLGFFFRRQRRG